MSVSPSVDADRCPRLRVLFTSGYPGGVLARRGMFDGKAAFIGKPCTPEALARKLREVLDG